MTPDRRLGVNAVGTLPHELLYESNLNQTFERDAMSVDTWEAVLRVFAKKGSHLLQPNCNSVEELLDAQQHPGRHRNLMVRVCGFSVGWDLRRCSRLPCSSAEST